MQVNSISKTRDAQSIFFKPKLRTKDYCQCSSSENVWKILCPRKCQLCFFFFFFKTPVSDLSKFEYVHQLKQCILAYSKLQNKKRYSYIKNNLHRDMDHQNQSRDQNILYWSAYAHPMGSISIHIKNIKSCFQNYN